MLKSPQQIAPNNSVQFLTGASSAVVALPTRADGSAARYVRVAVLGDAFIDLGDSGMSAAAGWSMLQPAETSEIYNVAGMTHIAHLQEDSPTLVTVSPLENQ